MNDGTCGFFDDDGNEINPDLFLKPGLCITCKKDDSGKQEMLCIINRIDQKNEKSFECDAYESKFE